jgi:DNA-binding FrmR family transcriptional regulator
MGNKKHIHSKKIINRFARIEGHVKSIKTMLESGRECTDIFIQIAAVRKALDNASKEILKEHLNMCLENMDDEINPENTIDEVKKTIDQYLK